MSLSHSLVPPTLITDCRRTKIILLQTFMLSQPGAPWPCNPLQKEKISSSHVKDNSFSSGIQMYDCFPWPNNPLQKKKNNSSSVKEF